MHGIGCKLHIKALLSIMIIERITYLITENRIDRNDRSRLSVRMPARREVFVEIRLQIRAAEWRRQEQAMAAAAESPLDAAHNLSCLQHTEHLQCHRQAEVGAISNRSARMVIFGI